MKIVHQSVLYCKSECVVNAANKYLQKGGGICGAIFDAAGSRELEAACNSLGPIETSECVLTSGYRLCKYIIHAVGPIYTRGKDNAKLLKDTYLNILNLAALHSIHSIAIPCISTGIYGYPLEKACPIVIKTIEEWEKENPNQLEIILACFSDKEYEEYSKQIMNKV